jgi:hypothetical protein
MRITPINEGECSFFLAAPGWREPFEFQKAHLLTVGVIAPPVGETLGHDDQV